MPVLPQILAGTLYTKSGAVIPSATLTFTNVKTNTLTFTTDASGHYVIDCNNFEDGVSDRETITGELTLDYDETDFDLYVSIDGGGTWWIAENGITVNPIRLTGRTKIDISNKPGGRSDLTIKV